MDINTFVEVHKKDSHPSFLFYAKDKEYARQWLKKNYTKGKYVIVELQFDGGIIDETTGSSELEEIEI